MDNCLTYALRTWRMGRATDHLVIRRSHWGWFPHFAVVFELADGSLVKKEYVPIEPRPRFIPPLFFKGVEKTTVYRLERVEDARKDHRAGRMEGEPPACLGLLAAWIGVRAGVAGTMAEIDVQWSESQSIETSASHQSTRTRAYKLSPTAAQSK